MKLLLTIMLGTTVSAHTWGQVNKVEKILGEQSALNRNFIKYYYDFKRRNNL